MVKGYSASCGCGWSGMYDTPARAAFALRRHSCARQQALRDRAARVAARKSASGPVRDCHHKQAAHAHGTCAAYVLDKCRCRACRDARAATEATMRRAKAYGTWQPYVDAQPVRDHIEALRQVGVGPKRIAKLTGVAYGVVSAIVYGKWLEDGQRRAPTRRVRQATAAKILALPADPAILTGSRDRVDPTGTMRRLQALIACGWSISAIQTATGIDRQVMDRALTGMPVSPRSARAVAAAYEQLWDTPPSQATHRERIAVTRSLNRAKANGWPPPAAWDDDDLDDPYAEPPAVDRRQRAGGFQRKVHVEDVEWLARAGESTAVIAQRLGVTESGLEKSLARAGRVDLIRSLGVGRKGVA